MWPAEHVQSIHNGLCALEGASVTPHSSFVATADAADAKKNWSLLRVCSVLPFLRSAFLEAPHVSAAAIDLCYALSWYLSENPVLCSH